MSVVINLPEYLCGNLFTDWIEVKYWGALDVAIGSGFRKLYIQRLSRAICSFPVVRRGRLDLLSFCKWVGSRNFRLNEVNLDYDLIASDCADDFQLLNVLSADQFLKVNLICAINFENYQLRSDEKEFMINDIINACTSLRSLKCSCCIVDFSLLNAEILSSLLEIELCGYLSNANETMIAIRDNCRLLTTFHLQTIRTEVPAVLIEVMNMNPNLSSLVLVADPPLLRGVLNVRFTSIQSLDITGKLESVDVIHILRVCPNLTFLRAVSTVLDSFNPRCTYDKTKQSFFLVTSNQTMHTWVEVVPALSTITELSVELNILCTQIISLFDSLGPSLTTLHIAAYHEYLSYHDLNNFLDACPCLTKLDVGPEMDLFWDRVKFPRDLLELGVCAELSEQEVRYVLGSCKHLRLFELLLSSEEDDDVETLDALRMALDAYHNVDDKPFQYQINWPDWYAYSD